MMKKMKAKLFVWILLMHLIAGAVAALVIGCAHKKKKKCLLGNVKERPSARFRRSRTSWSADAFDAEGSRLTV